MLVLTRREARRGSDKLYFALLSDFAASGAIAPRCTDQVLGEWTSKDWNILRVLYLRISYLAILRARSVLNQDVLNPLDGIEDNDVLRSCSNFSDAFKF